MFIVPLFLTPGSSFLCWTGTCRLLSVHIMTLKVPTSTRLPCPLSRMWPLGKESPFLPTRRSQRPGGYKTQVHSTPPHPHVQPAQYESHLDAISARPHVSYHLVVLVAELCFDFSLLCYRCRVVATWGLSQIHRRGSVWPRERSDGEVTRTPGDMRCERADAKSHGSGHVPGPVEDVHGQRVILRR